VAGASGSSGELVVIVVVRIAICPVRQARKWKNVSTANTDVAPNAKNCKYTQNNTP